MPEQAPTAAAFTLAKRIALVTGASSGIGREIACAFARAGAAVVLVARRLPELEATRRQIEALGGRAAAQAHDLSTRAGVFACAQSAAVPFGAPEILVAAAANNIRKPMLDLTEEDWDATMRLNLEAPFFLAQKLAPAMIAAGWGRIINIASQQSIRAFGNSGAYGVSKGAIVQLTRAQAEAWTRHGVTANAIAPGFVDTPLTTAVMTDPARRKAMAERTMIGRIGEPQDICGAAVFLASPAAAYVTGQTLFVDGGILVGMMHSRFAFYLLFTASGFAGLIYESIWTHYLKLFLGHAAYAQSLVLIVFMGGLALGSALMGRWSTRIARPLLAYALVEGIVGLLALAFHEVFVASTGFAYASLLPGLESDVLALAVKLGLSTLLILPQSVLLGMTFPLMSSGLVRSLPSASGESVAMLYFTNSLGAAIGVLVSGFVLIEWAGLPGTLRFAGLVNLALAAIVWRLARPLRPGALQADTQKDEAAALTLLGVAFFTGLASFIYEIAWIRMLSLVLGASTHSFELMLSTFILGLALGGVAVRRIVDQAGNLERLLGWVQVVMGLLATCTLLVYDRTFDLMAFLMKGLARTDGGYFLFNVAGQSIAAMVMLPAAICAGMTLPLITGALMRGGGGEAAIGKVYAANTLGAIAGVLLAVHVGLPMLGLKGSLIAGGLVDVALGLVLLWKFVPARRQFAGALAACALVVLPIALAFDMDVLKMTSGVFRYGDLESSMTAKILYQKDGKTSTVHLVDYSGTYSIRTNGKSDGSITMAEGLGGRNVGSDEITMVLTGAIPLAIKPHAKSAAVIGIGTGLTMHTLLQSLEIEQVETVEIEAAMAEASRGFSPRNGAAFADPRGAIIIDDAKSFFSTHNRRYDIIVSEPSNPWVSGVSSLFTGEFYRRVRAHLNQDGILVQWFQLYEVDTSLVASVLAALGGTFGHYAVFAPSDHDLLVVASDSALDLPLGAKPFEHPALTREFFNVHVLAAGDLDARYVGSRETLEPLFLTYGMRPNSDYYPVLDLNAARNRFTEKSAVDVVGLVNMPVPVLEMLEPRRGLRPVNPLFIGAADFDRIENARIANYIRDYLAAASPTPAREISSQLQKDLEVVQLRLIDCRSAREDDVWLHALWRLAANMNPSLPPEQAGMVWQRVMDVPCYAGLQEFQRRWIELFRAVGARDAMTMAALAEQLLAASAEINAESREYLWMAGLTGYLAAGDKVGALRLWQLYAGQMAKSAPKAVFRLLRCHAQAGDAVARASGCAAEFAEFARK